MVCLSVYLCLMVGGEEGSVCVSEWAGYPADCLDCLTNYSVCALAERRAV